MSECTFVTIMAGGVGSRFWPASREARPKQFLDMLGTGKSLIRLTFERFLPLCPAERIYVVTHQDYKTQVLEHLPELLPEQVICEPARRNTAPCIAYAALKLCGVEPEAKMIVAPSDHIILDESTFLRTMRTGLDFCTHHDALLTLGIRPNRPDTGYGYIQYDALPQAAGIHKVVRFTEKPPYERAVEFLASGDFLWNAGIFVWKAQAILDALHSYAPEILTSLQAGWAFYNTPQEQAFIEAVYPGLTNISIDFAVMEKAPNVFTLPADFGWSDLGTWASLHAESSKDGSENLLQCPQTLLYDCHRCVVRAPQDKLVVIRGLEDYIVVDEEDVLLIYPKFKEQEIKTVSKDAKENYGERYL